MIARMLAVGKLTVFVIGVSLYKDKCRKGDKMAKKSCLAVKSVVQETIHFLHLKTVQLQGWN